MSSEEENALLRDTPEIEDSSPGSETAVVSGGMAELRLASPGRPGTEKGGPSYASALLPQTLRRGRPVSDEL